MRKRKAKWHTLIDFFLLLYFIILRRYRMIHEVPPNITTLTLDGLVPNTEYELSIVALYYLPPSASQSSPSSRRDYSLDQTLSPIPSLTSPSTSFEFKTPTERRRIPEESASEPIKFISPDSGIIFDAHFSHFILNKNYFSRTRRTGKILSSFLQATIVKET